MVALVNLFENQRELDSCDYQNTVLVILNKSGLKRNGSNEKKPKKYDKIQ